MNTSASHNKPESRDIKGSPGKTKLSFSKALVLFNLFFGAILIIGVSIIVSIQADRSMKKIEAEYIRHEIHEINQGIMTFIDHRIMVLRDHADFPIISQGVMQPEALLANLVDFMDELIILGDSNQLVLLDYRGRIIHSTIESPLFNYTVESWVTELIDGRTDKYSEISKFADKYYWRIAVPVIYNGRPEGVLVTEIPILAIEKDQGISAGLGENRLEMILDQETVAVFGSTLHAEYKDFQLKNPPVTLRYYWDRQKVEESQRQLLIKLILALAGLTCLVVLVALLVSRKFFVQPIQQFRKFTHDLATKDIDQHPHLSDQPLEELTLLAGDFNKMADELNSRERALKKARDSLEIRVQERTKDLQESRKALQKANEMLEQRVEERTRELKGAQSQMVMQEKMATVGQLAAGIAHEINNPINFVKTNFDTLKRNVTDFRELFVEYKNLAMSQDTTSEVREKVEQLQEKEREIHLEFILKDLDNLFSESEEGCKRVTAIINSMRNFSRVDHLDEHSSFDINKGIEDTLVITRNEYKYHADIKLDLGDIPEIDCTPQQINQVMMNLIVNAAQAVASQERDDMGTITIRTFADNQNVYCEISDDGPGIPEEIQNRIFEPFFTTKDVGQGTGLGLSISYDIIVNKHGGSITVSSSADGTTFKIQLPIASDSSPQDESKKQKKGSG